MSQPHVRRATTDDLPAILEIYNEAVINTTATYDYEPSTLEARRAWFDSKREHGYPVLVSECDQVVLGFSTYGPFRSWPGYRFTVENSVYVHSEHRGKGIGHLLLKPLIEHARAQGLHTIIAGIDAANPASIALHTRLGFKQAGHLHQVGWKFDRWLDLILMELQLDQDGRIGR